MNEELWEAIIHCDNAYDGKFFYGVDTTGIFCRPSCKSKNPKRENARIFSTIGEAVAASFRPCKRCRPDQHLLPDEGLAEQTIEIIHKRYQEDLTLQTLSDMLHVSPYHLHRTFKRIIGETPASYLKQTRLHRARILLTETERNITEIAMSVGFPNAAHFATVFQKQFGLTPSKYRNDFLRPR